jgi:hypothetical protein
MKTYDPLRFSLMTEFTLKAGPHLRSLWADLMEMEAAADEAALSVAREQAVRRLLALGAAAGAVNAQEVRTLSHTLRLLVTTATQVRDATNYECFDALYKKMRELTEALYAIKPPPPLSERERQPAESALVESCAD